LIEPLPPADRRAALHRERLLLSVFAGIRDPKVEVAALPISPAEIELASNAIAEVEAKVSPEIAPCPKVQEMFYGAHLERARRDVALSALARLVLRPARLDVSPPHADLYFRASTLDLAIRRAGWDIDPGWVPFLGRVIRFHYEDGAP